MSLILRLFLCIGSLSILRSCNSLHIWDTLQTNLRFHGGHLKTENEIHNKFSVESQKNGAGEHDHGGWVESKEKGSWKLPKIGLGINLYLIGGNRPSGWIWSPKHPQPHDQHSDHSQNYNFDKNQNQIPGMRHPFSDHYENHLNDQTISQQSLPNLNQQIPYLNTQEYEQGELGEQENTETDANPLAQNPGEAYPGVYQEPNSRLSNPSYPISFSTIYNHNELFSPSSPTPTATSSEPTLSTNLLPQFNQINSENMNWMNVPTFKPLPANSFSVISKENNYGVEENESSAAASSMQNQHVGDQNDKLLKTLKLALAIAQASRKKGSSSNNDLNQYNSNRFSFDDSGSPNSKEDKTTKDLKNLINIIQNNRKKRKTNLQPKAESVQVEPASVFPKI